MFNKICENVYIFDLNGINDYLKIMYQKLNNQHLFNIDDYFNLVDYFKINYHYLLWNGENENDKIYFIVFDDCMLTLNKYVDYNGNGLKYYINEYSIMDDLNVVNHTIENDYIILYDDYNCFVEKLNDILINDYDMDENIINGINEFLYDYKL